MTSSLVRKSFKVILIMLPVMLFVLSASAQNMFRKITDFDGDGKTDYVVTRNENGLKIWYVWQSTAGFKAIHWGIGSDTNAAGDYDGDGKTDFAVYRLPSTFPSSYTFYILQSQTNTFSYQAFSVPAPLGDAPMQQDYDGDGKTDPAFWYFEFGLSSSMSIVLSSTHSLLATQIPAGTVAIRIGDLDGDGRADKAYYTFPGNLVTTTNLVTNNSHSTQFGAANDSYVPADFDGDGIGDLTVWRNSDGTWWWLRSSDNVVNAATWGTSGDLPVAGDYDGDGKTDLAVYRRESPQSHYWIKGSSSGVSVFAWGISTDSPVRY
jgi:hypothetical protein